MRMLSITSQHHTAVSGKKGREEVPEEANGRNPPMPRIALRKRITGASISTIDSAQPIQLFSARSLLYFSHRKNA